MSKFWRSFDKMFENMGEMFANLPDVFDDDDFDGKASSVIIQGGRKIVIKNINGKQTITVDGKEYVPREKKQ